ncbi:UDP-N-acetylmuramate dehydrogenase [Cryptosporangium phraense]|uniref:UDP-N-acetylenolpyruvoylglucosamine reductase n=1 Tax=Cryptosporangium phraense TaxID=2593070 RepID=A0A545AGB9_9ACTN|nr:UDP-N-acetylmuramate dehydrogenase [Cryptosporangium phraense]TQS40320.1 UDP-N-acetylmuramate dehydrogenase [Cryptosporangium phraense]
MSVTFADLTTMRVGGPVGELHVPTSTSELVETVRGTGRAALIIGGGSNLVVGDQGWPGPVIKVASSEIDLDGTRVTAAAGVGWDQLVELTINEGLAGLECLSGIPGLVGGTPIQNVGAYGALTSDVLETVTVLDRETGETESWPTERLGFGSHRQSVFKHSDRWAVVDVTFRLQAGKQSGPIKYAGLATALDLAIGGTAGTADVREAVLGLRRQRGMVLDPADHDTWSVGSFFINPVLAEVPEEARNCPQFPDPQGTKLAAAWLVHNAGFAPGYRRGPVGLSTRHALAVTNRGGATTTDVMEFAAHVREGVERAFKIRLGPECDLVNCSF